MFAAEDVWVPLRRRLSRVKGANRAFDRHVRSLDYRPTRQERAIGNRDVIICGSPRSGTTLLAAQLFQPPSVVSLMEPWDGLRMAPADLFDAIRANLRNGKVPGGRLDLDALRTDRAVEWTEEHTAQVGWVADDVVLAVKWPAWWQYLDRLPSGRFLVTVRHPYEVLDSYERTGGHLREGQDYPAALNEDVNRRVRQLAGRNLARRRAALYETVNRALLQHLHRSDVFVVRYERWYSEPDELRFELEEFLNCELGPWPAAIRSHGARPVTEDLRMLVIQQVPVARELGYLP
jgi:hypothetical protein